MSDDQQRGRPSGGRGRGRGRDQRFLNNLQAQMGGMSLGGNRRQQRGRSAPLRDDLPTSLEDFLERVRTPKPHESLTDLAVYYRENYANWTDAEVTKVAEAVFNFSYHSDSMYDAVGFLNVAFADERFQNIFTKEFVIMAAILLDESDPDISQYERLGGFIGHMLKTKFNRPFHLIVDYSNKLLVAVMNVLMGILNEIPEALGIDEGPHVPDADNVEEEEEPTPAVPQLNDEDLSLLKCKATVLVCVVRVMNRRLFLDHFDLNDHVYKVLRILLCDTDGLALGKDLRRMILTAIIDIEKFSVLGAKNSTTNVLTQTPT
uniref:N1221 domain-containing protein n=1 Tax=Panagrellus redivivus TaxID=6233 RepID=A0A7E4VGL7_PANRE